jgi:hypothetical protein
MGLADDIAAYLDEDPFGECGGRETGRSMTAATRPEAPPPPAASPLLEAQIVQDVKELFGGRIVKNYRHRRQSRRG